MEECTTCDNFKSQNETRKQHLKKIKKINRAMRLSAICLSIPLLSKNYRGDSPIVRKSLSECDWVLEHLTKYMYEASDEDFDLLKKNYVKLMAVREKLRRG